MSVYMIEDLRAAVRALVQNIPAPEYPDPKLDVALAIGKARLDYDRPLETGGTITGTGGSYFDLTAISGWVSGKSIIRGLTYPVPDTLLNQAPTDLDYKGYRLVSIGGGDQLYVPDRFALGKTAYLAFTTTWSLAGLSGATVTTLTADVLRALELVCAARACTSLAAKAAGTLDDQVPADLINYRTKDQEYQRAADNFMSLYYEVLNIDPNSGTKAIMVRADYDDMNAGRFLTHRRTASTR